MQGNLHVFLENPGGHGQTGSLEQSDGVLVEALGLFRRGGLGEVRAPAPASAGIQSKLANNKKLRPYIQGGAVKSVLFVGEDSQVNCLVNQVLGIRLRILCGDPQEHYQPRPNAANLSVGHCHRGLSHPLDQGPQLACSKLAMHPTSPVPFPSSWPRPPLPDSLKSAFYGAG